MEKLFYADNIVLLAEMEKQMQLIRMILKISVKRSRNMVFNREERSGRLKVKLSEKKWRR